MNSNQPISNRAKRCLVTGGAGFIGSHLVDRLLADGHSVTVLDNFSTGSTRNLSGDLNRGGLTVCNVDITEASSISNLFEGIDWVFHLAGLTETVPSVERPLDYHKANVDGTVAVLEASRKSAIKRFIYAASSSCYGMATQFPTPETATIRTEHPYALTKYLAECYVMHWNQIYNLPCVSLRLMNVYGPRASASDNYGCVFGVFLSQKLARDPFTIVGDGKQSRDFIYVTDVVQAFVTAAESDIAGEIFNVGSGGTYSINQLVESLGGEKIHIAKRPGEPACSFADTTKISQILGWRPNVSFDEGVAIMLSCIDDWRDTSINYDCSDNQASSIHEHTVSRKNHS